MSDLLNKKDFSIENMVYAFQRMKQSDRYKGYSDIEILTNLVIEKLNYTIQFDNENHAMTTEEFFDQTLSDLSLYRKKPSIKPSKSIPPFHYRYYIGSI